MNWQSVIFAPFLRRLAGSWPLFLAKSLNLVSSEASMGGSCPVVLYVSRAAARTRAGAR